MILAGEYARPALELRHLTENFALFVVLALVAGSAFWSVLHRRRWMWVAQGGMWATVLLLGVYYWPK